MWPSAKLLQAACSASNRAAHVITAAVMPLLSEQYHNRTQVTSDLMSPKIKIVQNVVFVYSITASLVGTIACNDLSVCAVFPQKNAVRGGAEIHRVCKTLPVLGEWQVAVCLILVYI